MKPRIKLAESTTSSGGVMALFEHDGDYVMNYEGKELMHSRANTSEQLLGEVGVQRLEADAPGKVLIGGLGLGFTLRSVLDRVGPEVTVEVAELLPEVVAWNEAHLQSLNGSALADPRVTVQVEDVTRLIRKSEPSQYDVILLDVDNGPVAMVAEANASLYSNSGLLRIRTALKARGRAVFWSAGPDPRFENRLQRAGFRVKAVPAKVHDGARRAAYTLFVADLG
jgi:spermidine synthase